MENTLTGFEYDSLSFFNTYSRLECTLKNIPEDFIVHEINDNMDEAGESNQLIPEMKTTENDDCSESSKTEKCVRIEQEYCEPDETMLLEMNKFFDIAKQYKYLESYTLQLPVNTKLNPEVLRQISAENPHICLQSRSGKVEFTRNPQLDELVGTIGETISLEIFSFIQTSRMSADGKQVFTYRIPNMSDKDQRRKVHLYFKMRFPYVHTTTAGDTIILTIRANQKRSRNDRGEESLSKRPSQAILGFILKKTNFELFSLKTRLAQLLNINEKAIGFAGIKDKRAVTYQFCTIRNVTPERLMDAVKDLPGVEVGGFRYVARELDAGHLWGNHFIITLRGIKSNDVESDVASRVNEICRDGFVNYFGTQRLGVQNESLGSTSEVGHLLMTKQWKSCLRLLLRPSTDTNDLSANDALICFQETGDAKAAARLVRRSNYSLIALLRGIRRYGCETIIQNDDVITEHDESLLLEVLHELPEEMLSFYVKAYQSLLFNIVVQSRVKEIGQTVLEGDLVREKEGNTVRFVTKEDIELKKVSIYDVVIPLFGYDILFPNNITGHYLNLLLINQIGCDIHGITKDTFPISLPGSYRNIAARPINMMASIQRDGNDKDVEMSYFNDVTQMIDWKEKFDKDFGIYKLCISFSLKKGLYATTLINEMTGCGCSQGDNM